MLYFAVEQHYLVALGIEGEIFMLERAAIETHQAVFLAEHAGELIHDAAIHAAVVVLGALADLCQLELVDFVFIEQVVEGKGKARLQRCGRRKAGAQRHIAGKYRIKALYRATALDGLAANAEDIACPLLLRCVLLVEAELTVGVHVHTENTHLVGAVDVDCSHDILIDSPREHKATVIVGVFTNQVNAASRCIYHAIGAKALLELLFNFLFHCQGFIL